MLAGCGQTNNSYVEDNSYIKNNDKFVDSIGKVVAGEEVNVRLDFPAAIEKICVKKGDIIEEGQTLAIINCEEYKKNILLKEKEIAVKRNQEYQATSSLASNEQEILGLENELKVKQERANDKDSSIIALQNKYEAAQSALQLQKDEYENLEKIYLETQGISQKEIKIKEIECKEAEKELNQIKASIEEMKEDRNLEIENLKAKIKEKKLLLNDSESKNVAEVSQIKLEEEIATIQLDNMREKLQKANIKDNKLIYKGNKKIVLDILNNEEDGGETKEVGTLMKLGNLEDFIIQANVPEELIKYVKMGAKVEIKPYADDDVIINGEVSRISEMATNVNDETVIQVDIKVPEKKALKIGYNVDVKIYYS